MKVFLGSDRIVPSASTYGALILFVAKKDGAGLRMYTDYYSLNSNTVTDRFLLPRIDELLVRLHSSKIFLKLDLSNGYYQIHIALSECHKTALIIDMVLSSSTLYSLAIKLHSHASNVL